MRSMLKTRGLRLIFTANVISMIGSGMNSAAVSWYVLQATHSEMALGTLMAVQTLPTLLLAPFSGVIIDREDRRRLVMILDGGRAVVTLLVAILCLAHRERVWHLYAMNILVAAGFWMFWPTINALIQELAPQTHLVHANTLLMAGVQGGWLIAGAVVGFVYNSIGLGGILLIDFASYSASLLCYFAVRKGRHVVQRPAEMQAALNRAEGAVARFVHETREGVGYLRGNLYVVLLGSSSSLLIGAMLAQNVLLPSLAERVLHAGAVGFGWINAGWGIGAFMSCFWVPAAVRTFGAKRSIAICMALLAAATMAVPFFGMVWISVALFWLMGATRGIGGVAITTGLMEAVPKYYMGRVQNTFAFGTRALQVVLGLVVGVVAERHSLIAGFALIAAAYAVAFVTAAWPAAAPLSPQPAAPFCADGASMLPDPTVEQVSSS